MKGIEIILFIGTLPIIQGLNCYFCASGMAGCNDPFSASAANVTTYSSSTNIFCVKTMLTSNLVSRYGSPVCVNIPFTLGIGTACCQTDLCNNAVSTNGHLLFTIAGIIIAFFNLQ